MAPASSISVSAATRLEYEYICILIRTYADLTFVFLSEVYDLFQLLCVLSSVFICFPPEVIFHSSSYWSLSCDHGLHCSDEFMREQHIETKTKKTALNRPASLSLVQVGSPTLGIDQNAILSNEKSNKRVCSPSTWYVFIFFQYLAKL